MWNNIVYGRGGLALHAGCKVIPVRGETWPTWATGCSSCSTPAELQAFVLTIPYSFVIVQGIVEGTIEWTEAPDFGYEVATSVQRRQYSDVSTGSGRR